MLVDTGADACFIDHQIAYTLGLNPVQGKRISSVEGIDSKNPTAIYPVVLRLTQFDIDFSIDAHFTTLRKGWNGLLGHSGFLDQFSRVTFFPGHGFELHMKD